MIMAIDTPSATSITTSSFTAPGVMRDTVPVEAVARRKIARLRPPSPTTMDEALHQRMACAPNGQPQALRSRA